MTPTLLQLFPALSFYRKIYPVYKFSWHIIEITFKVLNLLQNSEHLIHKWNMCSGICSMRNILHCMPKSLTVTYSRAHVMV